MNRNAFLQFSQFILASEHIILIFAMKLFTLYSKSFLPTQYGLPKLFMLPHHLS